MNRSARRLWSSLGAALLATTAFVVLPSAAANTPHVSATTITLKLPAPFLPVAPKGGHDLYHCALLDPKVTTDQMIVESTFTPGTVFEVHHEILYWVPPSEAATARARDNHGKGWTCFGGAGISGGSTVADLGTSQWLAGWSPGHGPTYEPTGTGMPLPAGSLIVMQIHYNLLRGHAPDQSKVTLKVVPSGGSGLIPLHINLVPSALDVPCPAGVSGPLCNRAASLADIGKRFGSGAVGFDNLLEAICSGGVPKPGDSATCTWPVANKIQYIWSITAHMHLLGATFKVDLLPKTGGSRQLLNVPSYNFDYQRSYAMSSPVQINPGDRLKVTCSWNPKLRSLLPQLKGLPPRYILWADGSSDEMCLAIFGVTDSLTVTAAVRAEYHSGPTTPQYPAALENALVSSTLRSAVRTTASPAVRTAAQRNLLLSLLPHLAHCT